MPKRGKNKPTGDYPVGYCKPPEATRFPPGKSGNTKRSSDKQPEETPTIAQMLEEKLSVIERGKKRPMSAEKYIYRKQMDKAFGGDLKSTKFLLERRDRELASRPAPTEPYYDLSKLTDEELDAVENILKKAAITGPGETSSDNG
jgi:hypothetical protein